MKKLINLAMVAMLIFGAASCTKDGVADGGNVTPSSDKLTFTMSGALASGITYATVAPETDESTIGSFDVLQFEWSTDATGVFVDKYTVPVIDLVTEGNKKKATISPVTNSGSITGSKYYIVVNGSTLANLDKATKLTGKTEADVQYIDGFIGRIRNMKPVI